MSEHAWTCLNMSMQYFNICIYMYYNNKNTSIFALRSYYCLQIETLAILCLHDEKGSPLKWIDSPFDDDDDDNDEKGAPIETDSPPS